MIDLLQLQNNEVSFVLTNDDTIQQLNKIYRGKDRPTDVLAFALREGRFAELAGAALGDVIVSVETAKKQADERRTPLLEEVTMLVAHGLLHLLGWDHETPAKDRRMRAETDRLCIAARAGGRSAAASDGPDRTGHRARRAGSKPGAERSLSRKTGSRHTAKSRRVRGKDAKKVEPSRPVKARRSRKI